MLQLVEAVEFIHSRGVYHRDIKPENIFLTQSGSMKLGDFGLATTDVWSYEIAVGSDRYMAPEQYDPSSSGYSTAKADIWAIGVCLLNVLFSRNPFAVPNTSDPLYADFVFDRESLFDVFPNMSSDTFEVLRYCLAVDPEKRDLSLVKEAIKNAVSFTTDDEILDDFCTEEREPIVASANREPLRTPSVSTPQLDQGGSFPWAKALAMSPPQPVRQLSAIPDTEVYADDMFPPSLQSNHKWFDIKPDNASAVSFVDSGLGLSFQSNDAPASNAINITRSRPVPISGSLPATAARPLHSMASVFGRKRDTFSKSWSDMWDEDEEGHGIPDIDDLIPEVDDDMENSHSPAGNNHVSPTNFKQEVENLSGSGVSTPRAAALSELRNPETVHNSRSGSPSNRRRLDDRVSQQTGFIFDDHMHPPSKYSPPPKRTLLDKWAALGDRRRAPQPQSQSQSTPQQTPQKTLKTPKHGQATPNSARKRSRTGSWRRPLTFSPAHPENNGLWERKGVWNMSKDWRQHHIQHEPVVVDDIGDLEWVGGWHDLHL
jgi:serine/threonine protein kinase